ncbi:hypothetical protein [Teredinibacter turnerae]|uniref:Amine oxidase family, flavin-containing protein n=1 Tax=Teredinibacter turnerae (strain ATCC 39867 / T7901) TaxID=377629 RepID=C6AR42_TERTT|nr:hypothetical protein [Teredinibacter turnerae]ACS93586.1 amine oxidase family, flavin-containing protein [Teredinibacter turnerae T7901]
MDDSAAANPEELASLLQQKLPQMHRHYIRQVNISLAKQDDQGMFGRASVAVVRDALATISPLLSQTHVQTAEVTLKRWIDEFLQHALQHNRSSCAISNFPQEHSPSQVYLNAVSTECTDLCRAWLND